MPLMWLSDDCPACGARNFVCNGAWDDPTGFDHSAVRCWRCGHGWSLRTRDALAQDDECCEAGRRLEVPQ
jgi:hypothetical protein